METTSLERFDIRIPSDTKQMLAKSAELNGCTLTALVMSAAMDKAREILQSHQLFELNEKDWQSFMHALENSPAPNANLQAAWDDYDADKLE